MIRSYFAQQYHEISTYFTALQTLLDGLPQDVRDDLMAYTSLGAMPKKLDDVEQLLEKRYPPFPETRRLEDLPDEARPKPVPLLRTIGVGL